MKNNFINLTEKEKDKPIFRIITISRLFQLFRKKELVLVRPHRWKDPFENFIMNSTGEYGNGGMFEVGFRNDYYAQCWTTIRSNDAMWRIYSPYQNGARISTTPRKLLKTLYDVSGEHSSIHCHIGKVKYYSQRNLKKLLELNVSDWLTDSKGEGQAQTLLFKRTAFEHESEVRLIFDSQGKINDDLFRYTVDPFDLIDDVVFDPRLEYSEFKKYQEKLKNLRFNKRIVKSTLYQPPKGFVFRLNL